MSMTPKLEETIILDFITSSATGAAADADSTPTAAVFEDATDTAILTPTVTKRTSLTGNYRVPVACTAANGFETDKSYNVVVAATIGGVAAKAVIGRFQVRAAKPGDTVTVGTNNDKAGYSLSSSQTFDVTGNITGNLSGSVGSVAGNVGGNVTGSVGSLATQAKADVNAEVDAAIETYHLDHLLAATYDPASKPGAADALLNELVESDSGVARFTANALEQAPTGGSAPTVEQIRTEIDANSTQLAAIRADTEDLQTQIGTAGVGLTALGDTRIANLDATVSSRLASASYTAPPSTSAIAAVILATPANLLATDGSGRVTVGSNADKAGYSLASPPPSAADNATAVWAAEARALTDKAGFALAAGGLDAIPTTAPSGVASNFREMVVQVWRRAFKRSTLTATQLVTYADDGSTVITTQAVSDDGDTQTLGAAT